MEKFIQVHDNIFDSTLQNEIENFCLGLSYKFTDTSTTISKDQPYCPIFGHVFLPDKKYSTDFLSNIVYGLSSFIKKPILQVLQGRAYIQVPNNSISIHPPHVDLKFPHWVCLYYVNDSDGDTIFYKDDKKTEIKRVSPKRGRVAFFDGSIYHSASTPTKHHRMAINISFLSLIHMNEEINAMHNL
tara:strand:+ start:5211 stop:5768 length:558 start_codon:yes stop_codon:yes gene_type:complete